MASDKVLLPKALTAENGAKALLMGEFFETRTITCPICEGDDNTIIDCFDCGGSGEVYEQTPISWTTIKAIYERIVKELATKPETSIESPPQPEQTGLKPTE